MVEEHDDLRVADLPASVQHQLHHRVEMCLAGRKMSWVHVICLKSGEEELTWRHVIAKLKKIYKRISGKG